MLNLSPNGTAGTFVEACYVNAADKFTYQEMNTLAENTAFLCQQYSPVLACWHPVRCVSDGMQRPYTTDSEIVSSYTYMAAGTYQLIAYTARSIGAGSAYSGSVYTRMGVEGQEAILCGFGTAGTTAYGSLILDGPGWVRIGVQIYPANVTQFIDNYYWIGYRRVVTT